MHEIPDGEGAASGASLGGRLGTDDLIPDSRLRDSGLDAFGHREIAARVADVALSGETPLNIALFGAWGSGKSSFFQLLTDEIATRHAAATVVRYDAWKFGGASLKRNFVSHAAAELGLDPDSPKGRPYHRGLYESVRTVDFNLIQFFKKNWKALIVAALGALALCTLVIVIAAAIWSAVSDVAFGSRFAYLAPGVYRYLGTALFAVGALINILATVNVEQTVPSEEERFADLFRDLVKHAIEDEEPKSHFRLIFFIDELDRCSREDVVATLTSLRTFLDQPSCVFVVAADRDVLEDALSEVEQATPVRESEPYYSSASAFLDKIFQHQVSLPPLRTGRLTRYARDLVVERGGLWADLRKAEPRQRLLNTVLYALIPAHVRSPRRVKVLLNNYATSVRVAQSRGMDWLGRATEIAKLTVLQTEFPHVAADLLQEPRLPTLLLRPPDELNERQNALVERHRLVTRGRSEVVDTAEITDPDTLLVDGAEGSDDGKRQLAARVMALRNRQRIDLMRYLTSRNAAGVPDPGRDLLYLEDAGRAVGLHDPDLSQLLEDYAADDPARVRVAIQHEPPQTRVAAARMLGSMSEREFGPERVNTVTALAQALEGLGPKVLNHRLGDLPANIAAYRADEDVVQAQIAGLLALAVAGRSATTDLRAELLADPRTSEDTGILAAIAPLLPDIPISELSTVGVALCRLHPQRPATLISLIEEHPETAAAVLKVGQSELVESVNLAEPVATLDGAASEPDIRSANSLARELVDCVIHQIRALGDEAMDLLIAAVTDPTTALYEEILARASDLTSSGIGIRELNEVCLTALSVAPVDHWRVWAGQIRSSDISTTTSQSEALSQTVASFAGDPINVVEELVAVLPVLLDAGDVQVLPEGLTTSIAGGLTRIDFWSSEDALSAWKRSLEVIKTLSTAVPQAADELAGLVATDIERAAASQWDVEMPARIAEAGLTAGPAGLSASVAVLQGTGAPNPRPDPDLAVTATTARLHVTSVAMASGLSSPPVPVEDVLSVAERQVKSAYEAISSWLATSPSAEDVVQVLAVTRARQSILAPLAHWAERQSPAVAADTFLDVVDSRGRALWLAPLSANVDSREAILDGLAGRLADATTHPERMRLAEACRAVRPEGYRQLRKTAEIVLSLLARDRTKVSVKEAAVLAPLLTGSYGLKGKVADAIATAAREGRMDKGPRRQFEAAGFSVPKSKGLFDKLVGAVRGR